MRFYQVEPTLENYWRGVILFGRNAATYKFALAQALYDIQQQKPGSDLILLADLAQPFSQHLCRHLQQAPKQGTAGRSRFLDACQQFNRGEIGQDRLTELTVRLGFANVLDAFHIVNRAEIATRFFVDERKSHGAIRLTENFYQLGERPQYHSLALETEARWRLVEQAWAQGISRQLIGMEYDEQTRMLFSLLNARRVNITSCRDALNGYQKGRCFYCDTPVSLRSGDQNLADVDHVIPWAIRDKVPNIDGVWNLVLACRDCNRGREGKFALAPPQWAMERLRQRNDYIIDSHLPLHETLSRQTGATASARLHFLQRAWNTAIETLIHIWQQPAPRGEERL